MGGGSPPDNLQTRDEEGSLKGFPINLFPECSKKKKKKNSQKCNGHSSSQHNSQHEKHFKRNGYNNMNSLHLKPQRVKIQKERY